MVRPRAGDEFEAETGDGLGGHAEVSGSTFFPHPDAVVQKALGMPVPRLGSWPHSQLQLPTMPERQQSLGCRPALPPAMAWPALATVGT